MFVRAVWHSQPRADAPRDFRSIHIAGNRDLDCIGLSGPDFRQMTRGLFDRV